jgi:hypothetical protein
MPSAVDAHCGRGYVLDIRSEIDGDTLLLLAIACAAARGLKGLNGLPGLQVAHGRPSGCLYCVSVSVV